MQVFAFFAMFCYNSCMLKEIVISSKQLLSDAIGENTDLGYYRIQKIIKSKSVKINGVRVGVDMNVSAGDVVYVYLPDREKNSIEVVYRDDNILVVNKTSIVCRSFSMETHPAVNAGVRKQIATVSNHTNTIYITINVR